MRLVSNVLERWSLYISSSLHFVLAFKWRVLLVLLGSQAWCLDTFLLCYSSYIGLMEATRGKARALNSCHIGVCSREEVILDLEGLIVVTFDVKSLSNPRLLAILNWCLSPEARRRVSHQNPLGMRHDIFS